MSPHSVIEKAAETEPMQGNNSNMGPGHVGAVLLMAMFALGCVGCIVAIPVCAYRFFHVLVETDSEEEQITAAQPVSTYAGLAPTAEGPAILSAQPVRLGLRYRIFRKPNKNRRPRKAAGRRLHP